MTNWTGYGRGSLMILGAALLAGCAATPQAPVGHDPHAVQVGPPGPAQCGVTAPDRNAMAAQVSNRARARAGLTPLRADARLARVAARHACDMAQRGRMTHLGSTTTGPAVRLKQAGYQPTVSAENIAAGPFSLPRVLSEWTASPGHHANIMLPQVRDFGVGQATSQDGRTTYWAAVYAAPR
ncbi:CAP domain-containing protein [Paracoccus marcusii]|uniref:CAP domain-containing protein n=1 Tax=Paracoccus marcusii TaxID=59779 RepID=A0ABY7UTD5_9RHOB|nr:CAP domain-containing protein [Paracoccus marcusii]WDA13206.1 CAP domain-containing protein [Paracoccus marcusii]